MVIEVAKKRMFFEYTNFFLTYMRSLFKLQLILTPIGGKT